MAVELARRRPPTLSYMPSWCVCLNLDRSWSQPQHQRCQQLSVYRGINSIIAVGQQVCQIVDMLLHARTTRESPQKPSTSWQNGRRWQVSVCLLCGGSQPQLGFHQLTAVKLHLQ